MKQSTHPRPPPAEHPWSGSLKPEQKPCGPGLWHFCDQTQLSVPDVGAEKFFKADGYAEAVGVEDCNTMNPTSNRRATTAIRRVRRCIEIPPVPGYVERSPRRRALPRTFCVVGGMPRSGYPHWPTAPSSM